MIRLQLSICPKSGMIGPGRHRHFLIFGSRRSPGSATTGALYLDFSLGPSVKVWILQTGEPLPIDSGDPRPMRAMNLSNELCKAGHEVVLWSADFSHLEKRSRFGANRVIKLTDELEVRLIKSPGYRRNIGFGRLYDHALLAFNLNRWLKDEPELPHVAFAGYPPIEASYVFIRRLVSRGVPVLLDIKDQWPEIFIEALPRPMRIPGRLMLWPYFYLAREAFAMATGISTMAPSFLRWALEIAGREERDSDGIFPLTSPQGLVSIEQKEEAARWWDSRGVQDDGRFRVCFVGSLSPAFDFEPVSEAARRAESEGLDIQFVICGEGGAGDRIRRQFGSRSNVVMPGWIDRPRIEVLAERSQAALTPYRDTGNFSMNMPNKVVDALALGLPLLSPLSGEVEQLISSYDVGYRYDPKGKNSLYRCLKELQRNSVHQARMSENAKRLYAEKFAFEIVYSNLVDHLEYLAARSAR